jgi:hypothetical protein
MCLVEAKPLPLSISPVASRILSVKYIEQLRSKDLHSAAFSQNPSLNSGSRNLVSTSAVLLVIQFIICEFEQVNAEFPHLVLPPHGMNFAVFWNALKC